MSSLTKRIIALVLWVPLIAYAARELTLIVDRRAPPVSDAKLPNREEAAKAHTAAKDRAAAGRTNVQAVATFGKGAGDEKTALGRRAAATENARQFLNGGTPNFVGESQKDFEDRFEERRELLAAEDKLKEWFKLPVPKNAEAYLKEFLTSYIKPFRDAKASQEQVADYELRGRHKIAVAFAASLEARYTAQLSSGTVPLPKAIDLTQDVDKLMAMLQEFRALLGTLPLAQVGPTTRIGGMATELAVIDGDWSARTKLLALFGTDPVKSSPAEARKWFEEVNTQISKLKDEPTKAIIREKAHQFCDAFLPPKFALDENVTVVGEKEKPLPRIEVKGRYVLKDKDDDYVRHPLTFDPDGRNEKSASKMVPANASKMLMYDGPTGTIPENAVKPTAKSDASFKYKEARAAIAGKKAWTEAAVAEFLQKAGPADGDAHPWDELSLLKADGKPQSAAYKAFERLKVVEKAVKEYPDLFEPKTP